MFLPERVVNLSVNFSAGSDTSINTKKKVFDKVMQVKRLAEEETILVEEMKQHWNSLIRSSRDLSDQANALSEDLANQSEY